jgi:hypothetical protein
LDCLSKESQHIKISQISLVGFVCSKSVRAEIVSRKKEYFWFLSVIDNALFTLQRVLCKQLFDDEME